MAEPSLPKSSPVTFGAPKFNVALSNLRAIVIIIVLAFHASLAYLASAPAQTRPFDQAPYFWQAFPIIDARHWIGLDVFCAWQDVSLMALMFLLSGLLASGSVGRKASLIYCSERFWRIGIPFVLAAAVLSPLAYYAAYRIRAIDPSLADFWSEWLSLPFWPSGPEWFLWQLLAVNALAAALYAMAPRAIDYLRRLGGWAGTRPVQFFLLLVAVSALAYVPLALAYSPWRWGSIGPFALQLSRPALYLTYFFAGFALGSYGLDRGLLSGNGPMARRWIAWLAAAIVSFGLWAGLMSLARPDWNKASLIAQLLASMAFPIACAAGGLLLLAICLKLRHQRHWILDSLSAHAYGIYLVHYVFVVWLQYALLDRGLFALGKATIVFTGALLVSWGSCIAFTRAVGGSRALAGRRAFRAAPW
jgi:surface polysaccharide O-acyltransferase-like enzyme